MRSVMVQYGVKRSSLQDQQNQREQHCWLSSPEAKHCPKFLSHMSLQHHSFSHTAIYSFYQTIIFQKHHYPIFMLQHVHVITETTSCTQKKSTLILFSLSLMQL